MLNTPFGVALTKEGMWSALEIPGMQAAIDLENRQQIMASATADHLEAHDRVPRAPGADLHQHLTIPAPPARGARRSTRRSATTHDAQDEQPM